MATPTLAPRTGTRTQGLIRLAAGLLLLGLLAAAVAALWAYSAARASLPQLDGAITLAGISAPITVARDAHGVPHINAANLPDLFFAQGYVTAQDRLWQMDMTRRFTAGQLAEILGPDLVRHDRRQRVLGMQQLAAASAVRLSPAERSLLEAYARGVNAYMAQTRDHPPIEFRILRYAPPAWTVEDSMLAGLIFHQMLTLRHAQTLLDREKVIQHVGLELAADLFPVSSWRDRIPGSPRSAPEVESNHMGNRAHSVPTATSMAAFSPPAEEDAELVPGSNNWVVSGAHTASGKPLLSNDMHLPHRIPNTWYEVHLSAADFDVAGFTAPGLPFVVAGHNRRIAWGFTSIEPFVLDLYQETFNAQGEYQTPEGWRKPEYRHELIRVKGKPAVAVDVTITRHGPIVSELFPDERRPLALRWTAYESADIASLLNLNGAQNWDEFLDALARFSGPPQNVVYADADGHIGYHASGLFPLRPAGSDSTGPVPGNDNAHEWQGTVPFDQLPSSLDPPGGIIATANARIIPPGSSLINTDSDAPFRTQRIYRMLESKEKLTPADMLNLQTDVYSNFDRFCAERLVYAVDHAKDTSPRARQAAELMRGWDGRLTADSAAPTLAAGARRELVRLLLEPKLGKDSGDSLHPASWQNYHWGMSAMWLESVLLRRPARWLPPSFSSYDDLLTAAVEAAITSRDAPQDLASWSWGKRSPVTIEHPIFGNVPVLRRWSGPGTRPQSGGRYTVKQVGRDFGPSERMTVDLSSLDDSTFNIVTGQSGHILSPHYMDQWPAWYQGRTFKLPFSPEAVQKSKAHELLLKPQ